jgi:hypothetical protein
LTRQFSEAPLLAVCGQNIRRVRKKIYGPLDLVSSEAQTDASDNVLAEVEYRQYVEWRDGETVEIVTPDKTGESDEIQPLESEEIIVDEKTERKLLRAWKKLN